MFLAVPLTMLLKVSLSDSEEFGWFSLIFIGSSSADVNTDDPLRLVRLIFSTPEAPWKKIKR